MKGLIIKEPYVDYIVDGKKCWEMRKTPTTIRGPIALIKKGSGLIVGVAKIVDSLPELSASEMAHHFHKHRIPHEDIETTEWRHPWVLESAQRLRNPVPYEHPSGAVIWVNLHPSLEAEVRRQAPTVFQ